MALKEALLSMERSKVMTRNCWMMSRVIPMKEMKEEMMCTHSEAKML
jgi:hypothetical protein